MGGGSSSYDYDFMVLKNTLEVTNLQDKIKK